MAETRSTSSGISWLRLLRASGEGDVGAGIERLARLAAAAHRQAEAQRVAEGAAAPTRREVER